MPENGNNIKNNSPLFEYPLGQCLVYFNGYKIGKTTADTILKVDRDLKEIMFSQDGTKPVDWVNTGEIYSMDLAIGETSDELIALLDKSWDVDHVGNGVLERDLFTSYRTNRAKGLKLVMVDGNGQPLSGDENQFNFYEAIPIVNGDILQYGPDTQKTQSVTFNTVFHEFADGESATRYGGYGYFGDPTLMDVPPINYPPIAESATTDATTLTLTFDKNVAFVGGAYTASSITIWVNGVANVVTIGVPVITTTAIAITLLTDTITIAAGDVVTISIDGNAVEDTTNNNNILAFLNTFAVTNTTV